MDKRLRSKLKKMYEKVDKMADELEEIIKELDELTDSKMILDSYLRDLALYSFGRIMMLRRALKFYAEGWMR